jgi:hypothetical protein
MSELQNLPAEDDAEARSRAEEQETLREVEDLVRRQEWAALRARLEPLAPESVARILDALPPDESVQVWELLDKEQGEDVLDEMSDALQDSLDEEPDEARCRCLWRPAGYAAGERSGPPPGDDQCLRAEERAACARSRSTARTTSPPRRRSGWTCWRRRRKSGSGSRTSSAWNYPMPTT